MFVLAQMNKKTPWTRRGLRTDVRDSHGEKCKPPTFGLATKRFRACRVVRAMRAERVLGAGLGFPLGGTFGLSHPNSDNFLGDALLGRVDSEP